MKIERLSYKKIRIIHNVPIYYRYGNFISEKISERKVCEIWKEKDGRLLRCGYKHKFICALSVSHSFRKKDISINLTRLNFDFEEKKLNLEVTNNFYFDINDKELRDYKIKNLLDGDVN